jgi:hypothetical protein
MKKSLALLFFSVAACGTEDPSIEVAPTHEDALSSFDAGCSSSDMMPDFFYEDFAGIPRQLVAYPTYDHPTCRKATIIDVHSPQCSDCTGILYVGADLAALPPSWPTNATDCRSLVFGLQWYQWKRPPEGGARRWILTGISGETAQWDAARQKCSWLPIRGVGPFAQYDTRFLVSVTYKGGRLPFNFKPYRD